MSIKLIKTKKGYSLLEALAAIGIGGVILAGVMYAFVNAKKQEVLYVVKEDASSLSREMEEILKGPACGISRLANPGAVIDLSQADFFGNPSNVIELPEGISSGQLSVTPGQVYGKVKVNNVTIGPRQIATMSTPTYQYVLKGEGLVLAQVIIEMANMTGTGSSDNRKHESRHDIFLHLDSTGKSIIDCTTLRQVTVLQEGCDAFGGEWNEDHMRCTLKTSTPTGATTTCPFNDVCGADPEFKL